MAEIFTYESWKTPKKSGQSLKIYQEEICWYILDNLNMYAERFSVFREIIAL